MSIELPEGFTEFHALGYLKTDDDLAHYVRAWSSLHLQEAVRLLREVQLCGVERRTAYLCLPANIAYFLASIDMPQGS